MNNVFMNYEGIGFFVSYIKKANKLTYTILWTKALKQYASAVEEFVEKELLPVLYRSC